jgi:basic membrane protein A
VTALVAATIGAARTDATAPAGAAAPAKAAAPYKVAVVTDIGGLNDRSFNFLANQGRLRAQKQLGVQTRIYITRAASDRLPNLVAAARAGNNLVIGVGFFMGEHLDVASKSFPKTKFAGVDVSWADLKSKPKNVRGLVFKEEEAGYLAGYLAGLTVKRDTSDKDTVSAIGAIPVPAIVKYIAGYKAGAEKAFTGAKVLSNYANDSTFSDQAKCKEQAINQIAAGSSVIFAVAGGCGLGALDAAKEQKLWGVGVDADQYYLGAHMLTSAIKKVDVAVYKTIEAGKKNGAKFRGGYNAVFDTASGGVGYGRVASTVPKADVAQLEAIRKQLVAHKITVPQK